jgi:hypothetical protein
MANSRGKGTADGGAADTAAPRARRARTRAPEDEIGGTAAPVDAAPPARARRAAPAADVGASAVPAAAPPAEAPPARARRRPAPDPVVDESPPPAAKPKKSRGGKKRETYVETAARRRREKEVDQLQADLRAFAIARPAGWNHDDWTNFLGHLAERGHDVSDHGSIGIRLERERLAVALEAIEGLGPKRVHALVERFQTLWSMRHADAGAVQTVPGMTRPLAERVVQQMAERFA